MKSGNHGQKCISTESEVPGAHLENTNAVGNAVGGIVDITGDFNTYSGRDLGIAVGMGNEEVLRLMNLLRRQVRNPVQAVGGRPGVHNKSVAVTLHVETVSSFVTASTCYEKLHIHISIRTLARFRQFDFPAAFRLP